MDKNWYYKSFVYPLDTSYSYAETIALEPISIQNTLLEIYSFDQSNDINLNDYYKTLDKDKVKIYKKINLIPDRKLNNYIVYDNMNFNTYNTNIDESLQIKKYKN